MRSGPLAAWTCAWLAGAVASDEVLRAVTQDDGPHRVVGLAGAQSEPLSEALIAWRRAGGSVRLVLPVPGDVRGLPGPAAFRSAALAAGEAVVGGAIGLVPHVSDHSPSSAPPSVLWTAFVLEPAPDDPIDIRDAQHELAAAIRRTATALSAAGAVHWMDDVTAEIGAARRAGERLNLPPGFPAPAVGVLAQAERMQAILDLAARDPLVGALDLAAVTARAAALRPLAAGVRRARLAGYNALA
jgi:hypothetical protein